MPGNAHDGPQFIWDAIVTYDATDKWSIAVESLYGRNGMGSWYGVGVWNRYMLNDWIAFSNRFEYFNDSSNARVGALRGETPGDDGYDTWDITFGIDFNVYENMMARLEYRVDKAPGADIFSNNEVSYQNSFLAKFIYSF
jgi:opacity protein-like surface antigen